MSVSGPTPVRVEVEGLVTRKLVRSDGKLERVPLIQFSSSKYTRRRWLLTVDIKIPTFFKIFVSDKVEDLIQSV